MAASWPPGRSWAARDGLPSRRDRGRPGREHLARPLLRESRPEVLSRRGAAGHLGRIGERRGELFKPGHAAVDRQGRVYVADWGNSRIQVFDGEGRFLAAWGGIGSDAGELNGPNSLVLDGAGNVYVTDDGNDRVQKFHLLPPLAGDAPAAALTALSADPAEFVWQTKGGPDLPFDDPQDRRSTHAATSGSTTAATAGSRSLPRTAPSSRRGGRRAAARGIRLRRPRLDRRR